MRRIILIFLCLLPCLAAADYDKGLKAYEAGNLEVAAREWLEVAPLGDHRAMMALGAMYAGGRGVKQDYAESLRWFKEAARYGRADATYRVGLIYEAGLGVRANPREAAHQFLEAAKQGFGTAQLKVGGLYRDGEALEQDPIRAYAWFKLAEQSGKTDATAEIEKITATMSAQQLAEAELTLRDYTRRYPLQTQ